MIITTAKILHSTLLKIIFAVSVAVIILAVILAKGLSIPEIDLPGLKIKEFYIKLDKKLIIEIDRVEIGKKKKSGSALQELDNIGNLLRFIPHFFEKIQINDIVTGEETAHLLFFDDVFYAETDKLELATRIFFDPEKKILFAKIETLYILKPDLTLKGRFAYDVKNHVWKGEGRYSGLNLNGLFSVWHKKDLIGFNINSEPTDSIKPLVDYLDPPPDIKVWIYPKIPAKRYILHDLKGEITLKQDGKIVFDPEKVTGFATAYDADIHFHPDVPPVHTRQIDIRYRHDILGFKLYNPLYRKKKLDGSYVRIRNLLGRGGKTELDAHIVVKDRFDDSIRNILGAYNIPIPFVQTKGTMDAVVDFTVALADGSIVSYKGDYKSESAELLFDNVIPIPVENLHVISDNNLVTIKPCRIRFDPYLKAALKGTIDLDKKDADFYATIDKFKFPTGRLPLLSIQQDTLHVKMDFKKHILFNIPSLDASLQYRPGGEMQIALHDLSRLKHYFEGPLKPIEEGVLNIIHRPEHTDVKGEIDYKNDILLQEGKPLEHFTIEATLLPEKIDVALNDTIRIHKKGKLTTIHYANTDINVIKLRELLRPYLKDQHAAEKSRSEANLIHIYGKTSTIHTQYAYLPCDALQLKITTSHPFSALFESKHGSGTIRGIFYDDNMKIVGRDLSDKVAHGIPPLDNLYGGYFDFDTAGKIDDFNGTMIARDTMWAKSAVYNNVLAALNSIPAILMLKNPGFSNKGFKIKKAVVQYHYKAPIFTFENINIHGKSANIFGKGKIDFEKEHIDIKMRIQFLETISATMHKIPVAGYILFGDNGKISIGLSVEGRLDDPKVHTTAAKDIVTAPINIMKRTFTFPFHLFK